MGSRLRMLPTKESPQFASTHCPTAANGASYAILKGRPFHNGTIEVDLAGKPAANAGPAARGFIGIAFRLQGDRYEYIYLRPTNGRADDQVRRNHSTQYGAQPAFDFDRLGKNRQRSTSRTWTWTRHLDEVPHRGGRDESPAIRARSSAALPNRQ